MLQELVWRAKSLELSVAGWFVVVLLGLPAVVSAVRGEVLDVGFALLLLLGLFRLFGASLRRSA